MIVGITGATGFVGSNLTAYLRNDSFHEIFSLNRPIDPKKIFSNKYHALVHLAGKAHDLKKSSNPEEYYQVNYELTKSLYDAYLASSANKFIFISSVKAAGDNIDIPLTEEHIPAPLTDYGKSKLLAEQYIQGIPLPEGKSFYILRPCMIHGPGNKGNLNLFYNFVSKGLPYPLASFQNKRSFLSVGNLCFVIKELIERDDIPSGVYHVADDEALSTNELVAILAESLNKSPTLWPIPVGIIKSLAKIGDRLKLPLNTERLSKLTENYVVSNAKIKGVLGKKLPLSAREGIGVTAKSFKSCK